MLLPPLESATIREPARVRVSNDVPMPPDQTRLDAQRPGVPTPPSLGPLGAATAAARGSVYFAACFSRQTELLGYAAELHERGFLVRSRWLDSPTKLRADELHRGGRGAEVARMDLEDLRGADVCIAFTETIDASERGRGGRHTELGIALGLGQLVLIVGPREHVFHCLPDVVHHPDWRSARSWLCHSGTAVSAA